MAKKSAKRKSAATRAKAATRKTAPRKKPVSVNFLPSLNRRAMLMDARTGRRVRGKLTLVEKFVG